MQDMAADSQAPGSAAVRVSGLTKSFDARRPWSEVWRHPFDSESVKALTDVSLEIAPGEFFGLLGPNGAGKTTLFKILATLVTPDSGEVTIGGHDVVRGAAEVRRLMTPVIADERSLRWRLSAFENVRLFAVLYGLSKDEVDRRSHEVLSFVGLQDTGEKMVGQFSSGMKQRVMIARALLPRPQILLLDEPTRGLDPISARELRTFLRDVVCGQQGCTVLLATHSSEEAFELCDRVGVMNKGRLLLAGPTADLVAEYADDRYRVFTTMPEHAAIGRAAPAGTVARVGAADRDGWTEVEFRVAGGPPQAAEVLKALVAAGVEVSRFERETLTLADLIERVMQRAGVSRRA